VGAARAEVTAGRGRDSNTLTLDVRKLTWELVATGPHDGGGPNWPNAFCCYGLVYDRDARVALLYGGLEEDRGTWAFDFKEKRWTNRKPKAPPLFLHSMVYDPANKVPLLFGGQTGNYSTGKAVSETWAYHHDTSTWKQRHPRAAPAPRAQARASFGGVSGVMLLFGGHAEAYPRRAEGKSYADTWAYDYKAGAWTQMKPRASPASSAARFMAFDPVASVAVNVSAEGNRKETWVYRYKKAGRTAP
jgi:hypothetical protein